MCIGASPWFDHALINHGQTVSTTARLSFLLEARRFYSASRSKHHCAASYLIRRKLRVNFSTVERRNNAISRFDQAKPRILSNPGNV
jgi:hypothetical protein